MLDGIVAYHMIKGTYVERRLFGLVGAIVLIGLGIAFLTTKLQWHSGELRAQLIQVDSESFRIADEFADYLRQLNDALHRYGGAHVPPDRQAFTKASQELELWIERQKRKLTSEQERATMQQ